MASRYGWTIDYIDKLPRRILNNLIETINKQAQEQKDKAEMDELSRRLRR